MHKVVTSKGWEFNVQSLVEINGKRYDLDEMTQEQHDFVAAQLSVQGLNAAYAGEATFQAEGLRSFAEVFP